MASIKKRGSSWWGRIRLKSGKWVSFTAKRKSEVENWAAQVELGQIRHVSTVKVADVIQQRSQKLKYGYEKQAFDRFAAVAGHLGIGEIGRPEANQFYNLLIGSKRMVNQRTRDGIKRIESEELVAPGTANRQFATIRKLFNDLVREGMLESSPFQHVKTQREDNIRTRFLQTDEMDRFMSELHTHPVWHFRMLILLALATGQRAGAILSLRWADLDFGRNLLIFRTTKNGWPQATVLPESIVDALRERKTAINCSPGDLIVSADGQHTYSYSRTWYGFVRKLGLTDLRVHDLRRTVGSYLAMSGASEVVVRQILGHLSPEMSSRYQHLAQGHAQGILRSVMDEFLSPAISDKD